MIAGWIMKACKVFLYFICASKKRKEGISTYYIVFNFVKLKRVSPVTNILECLRFKSGLCVLYWHGIAMVVS